MTQRYRIVTPHMLERTAAAERRRLVDVQIAASAGDEAANAKLAQLGIKADQELFVRPERHRRFRWAVAVRR